MKKILESEYSKAKETIEEYERLLKCDHKNTVNRIFYDAGPFGQNYSQKMIGIMQVKKKGTKTPIKQ